MRTLAFLLSLPAAATAQVAGSVTYEDRVYTSAGFTGATVFRPVREAEVEIVRVSDGAVLGTGVTTGAGTFAVAGVPPGQAVQARVYARRQGGRINVSVRNNAFSNAVYTALTPAITTTGSLDPVPPLALSAGGAAPAFNILDAAVKSFQYQATVDADLPALPPPLTVYWEAGTANGTYFSRTVNAVFLLGLFSDPDEYDDDILLHEIGHWVAFNFSKDDTLGGPHTVIDQLDPRTAWSEGWAHYWSSAVRRFFPAEYSSPAAQVDNFASSSSFFDLEGPSFPGLAVMATNELAVAAALWDITDPANEPFDLVAGNEPELWRAVNDRLVAMAGITLEDFRAGLALEAPGIMGAVTGTEGTDGVMKDRRIRYYPDGSESNDSAAAPAPLPLAPASLPERTFFGTGDEDWFAAILTPGTLVAETLNLGDGGDTRLELYDASGTVLLAANNDRSPTDRTSLIQFPIAAGGTYLLRVARSGTVIEHGHYEVRAQIVLNQPPILSSVTVSTLGGPAPLRVTLTGAAADPEQDYLEFAWDFDGDGRFDWSSLGGPTVTTTYPRAGTFTPLLRVTDSANATALGWITITVLPSAAPSIAVTQNSSAGVQPALVAFGAALSGITPVSYAWDFESDGVVDRVSVTGAAAPFTYRAAGSFTASLVVTDTAGRAFAAVSNPVSVGPAPFPPSIGPFAGTGGVIPHAAVLDVAHGAVVAVELDFDGDGRYDLEVPPDTLFATTEVHEVQRVGTFALRARVRDAAGLTAAAGTSITCTAGGVRGWLVDPRAGDRLAGTALTLTAEAVPANRTKKVRFQYRADSPPGAWIDIGAPRFSEGTLFSAAWDLSGFLPGTRLDLRILIDDLFSSGDDANTVEATAFAPTIREAGAVREKEVSPVRTTVSRNGAGVWAIAPKGSVAAAGTLRIEPASAPLANGSALGLAPAGGGWRVGAGFANAFKVRLPFAGDGSALEVHAYEEAAGVWYRPFPSRVAHDDGWVEADAGADGIYALFRAAPPGVAGGSECSGSVSGASPSPALLLLALGLILCCRNR